MAANSMPTLSLERVKAGVITGVISLSDPPFGTDSEEALVQGGAPGWQLSKRPGYGPQTLMQLSPALDRVGPHVGAALSLRLPELAQHAPSPDSRREGPR